MESIMEMIQRGFDQLIARADGPLHFRLIVMPFVVTTIATIAGLRDAREGRAAFGWSLLTQSGHRAELLKGMFKDMGKVFVSAILIDTVYQLWQLASYYPIQALIVAFSCAVLPYLIIRGPVNRIARLFHKESHPEPDVKAA